MKKIILFVSLITAFCFSANAQKQGNIWCFGNNAGLDFNSGTPVAITNGPLVTTDNSSTIADSTGSLLFTTNGVTVWNKNGAVMYNGTGLLGNVSGGQCTLIVPQPSSHSIYYVFSLDGMAGPNGLHYSVVDMSQQAGLGAVTTKNVLLYTPTTEKIDATFNSSTNSYWVLTHGWNSDYFYDYSITSTGIDTVPVISSAGSVNSGGAYPGYNAMGQMTFSKDGSRIASGICSAGTIELLNFNITTGVVSNPITITGLTNAWGVAFSPDGNKLYATEWETDHVLQFDLTTNTAPAIMASETLVGHATNTSGSETGYQAGYLQLGPDGKIYVARFNMDSIAVINSPNSVGTSCNFVNTGVYIGPGICQVGLSRVCVGRTAVQTGINELSANSALTIYPNPSDGIFNISLQNNNNDLFQMEIYDVLGQKIYQTELNLGINQLRLVNKSPGIYLYKIFSQNNSLVKTGKIVIQK